MANSISIKERLPDEGVEVLVFYATLPPIMKVKRKWAVGTREDILSKFYGKYITHWEPLPPDPEDKSKNT